MKRIPDNESSIIAGVTIGALRKAAADKTYTDRVLARMFLAMEEGRGCRLTLDDLEQILVKDDAIQARLYMNMPEAP